MGDEVPEGVHLQVAGLTDDGLKVIEVWDSPEHIERYMEAGLGQARGRPPARAASQGVTLIRSAILRGVASSRSRPWPPPHPPWLPHRLERQSPKQQRERPVREEDAPF
jgi:hypothetical protein